MKLKVEKTEVTNAYRTYSIKNKNTGKFVQGTTYDHVLEYVPGKKKRQRVSKRIVWECDKQYYQDIEEVNKIIKGLIHWGFSSYLDSCEILSYHRITGVIPIGKLDMIKRKDKFEQEAIIKRLKS